MSAHSLISDADPSLLSRHVDELRNRLRLMDVHQLAANAAVEYGLAETGGGELYLPVWGRQCRLALPGWVAGDYETRQELSLAVQALLLYYFVTADGAPQEGRWVSFSELPDGRFYNQAFQGYTGRELARFFQNDLLHYKEVALSLGGVQQTAEDQPIGDLSIAFQPLPRVPLLIACWQGDEDFPASFQILFDASASHYLPTDVCAILGSMLTRKIIAVKGAHG